MNLRVIGWPILLMVCVSLFVWSCSDVDDRSTPDITAPQSTRTEWTVMFYGAGNFTDDVVSGSSQVLSTVRELEEVPTNDAVKVVALCSSPATSGACLLYEVEYHPSSEGEIESTLLADWGARNTASPEVFADYLGFVAKTYPAERYLLVVSGGGEGWRGACLDEVNGGGTMLPVSDMRRRIESTIAPDGRPLHVALLVWMAPAMSMVEVAYEFSRVADYMVAHPDRTRLSHARAVSDWTRDLTLNPAVETREMGRLVLRAEERAAAEDRDDANVTLLDLGRAESLAAAVNGVGVRLTPLAGQYTEEIVAARDSAAAIAGDSLFVDLGAFMEAVSSTAVLSSVEGLVPACTEVERELEQLVVERRSTDQSVPRGVMIHYPATQQQLDIEAYQDLLFSREHAGWAELLSAVTPAYREPVQIGGFAKWVFPQRMVNVKVFVMQCPASAWSDVVLETPVEVHGGSVVGDSIAFGALLSVPQDSLYCRIGLFLDTDSSGFGNGDFWGFGRRHGAEWLWIRSGETLDSVFVFVNNQR